MPVFPPILARMDSLWPLLIFIVITIVASWLQKRQKSRQEEGEEEETPLPPSRRPRGAGAPPPLPSQPPAQKPLTWEEELKRLLEGQTAEPAPPPPPPPVIVQPRRPAPIVPPPLPEAAAEHHVHLGQVEVAFKPLPGLTESTQAYEEASTLEQKVQQHLRAVTQKPVGMTHVEHRAASPEATQALHLIRQRESVRAAILASVILGPPRALSD